MDKLEKAKRLKEMLAQIAPDNAIESVARPVPKTEGGVDATEGMASPRITIESGLEKIAKDRHEDITPQEMSTIEAIVMPKNRPVAFVREDTYDKLDEPWGALNVEDVRTRLNPLLPLIGRVEVPNSPILPYAGTGFVVGRGLLATNRHVAQIFAQGLGRRIRYQSGDAGVDFRRQVDAPDDENAAYLSVTEVVMIHPYWDMALLKVEGLPNAMLNLSTTAPEDLVGRNIVAIGYPALDPRSDLALQDKIFGGVYQVKRVQPGVVRARAKIQSFENEVSALTHDASTLGGNSGSAIIDVETGKVLALHFAGEYLKANYAVPMYELARDNRVVAAKLNFEGAVAATNAFDSAWRSTETKEAPRADVATRPATTISAQSPPAIEKSAARWTIPLEISISVGAPSLMAAGTGLTLASEAEVETVVVDQDYSDREGYDPDFLEDVSVPLPGLDEAMQKDTARVHSDARKNGDEFELAYHHYSVYMNKRRRTAWYSAANVDGDRRPDIGKRSGDRWYVDPRIGEDEQLSQKAFEPGIDRGHLTRREDTAWGDDVESATAANNDTFHFTNCSLQASPFNRGKDRWQGLEQFLLEQHAKKERKRMIVITGPLFADNDPVYQNDRMDYSVRCPIQFWKVCVLIRRDGASSAAGFVLGQEDIKDLPGFEEAFDVAAAQIRISDLEKRTGLDFGDLKMLDRFAKSGADGKLELPSADGGEAHIVKPLRSGGDIVV